MKAKLMMARVMVLLCTLSLCSHSFGGTGNAVEEDPSALAMVGDLVVVRPVALTLTAIGAVTWLVTLPFTAASGSVKSSGDTLVVGPAMTTFVRCLGCTQTGYQRPVE